MKILHKFSDLDINSLKLLAKELLLLYKDKKIWLFEGEMGSGKTTLVKYICQELKVDDNVNSPTFNIINEYNTKDNKTIYHFDLYRLNNETQASEIGLEEYFESGEYCFIEWPSNINLRFDNYILIEIKNKTFTTRDIFLYIN